MRSLIWLWNKALDLLIDADEYEDVWKADIL